MKRSFWDSRTKNSLQRSPAEFNGFKYNEDHYHICIQDNRMGTHAIVRNQLYLTSKGITGPAPTVGKALRHVLVTKPRAILYGPFG